VLHVRFLCSGRQRRSRRSSRLMPSAITVPISANET
jgi:hypothetical protein